MKSLTDRHSTHVRNVVLTRAIRLLVFVVFVNLVFVPQRSVASDVAIVERPATVSQFVDSIGVDTHFNYTNTPYVTLWPKMKELLVGSGIRHIRDGGVSGFGSRLDELAAAGIKHSLQFNIGYSAENISSALDRQQGTADFVEPQNEYDSTAPHNPGWVQNLVAEQTLIYNTVHADPKFSGVVVLGPAMNHQRNYAQLGLMDAIEDAANLHNATCNLNPGTSNNSVGIAAMTKLVRRSTMTKSIWTTETGYGDNPAVQCSLPDDVIAKYDPRTVAERFNAGQGRTYFYEFADAPNDKIFGAFGIVSSTGEAKPQYTSLRSLIAALQDSGNESFTTHPTRLTLQGDVTNVHHTLLERSDGMYVLLLWLEAPSWKAFDGSNIGGTTIPVEPRPITLSFPSPVGPTTLYRYGPRWTLDASSLPVSEQKVSLTITDSICLVEFRLSAH